MRVLALLTLALCAGISCDADEGSNPDVTQLLGSYDVNVSSGSGPSEVNVLTVTTGAAGSVLLSFVYGFSTIRAVVTSRSTVEWSNQTILVERPSGKVGALASGRGTFRADGTVELTLSLEPGGPDAGGVEPITYAITGRRH